MFNFLKKKKKENTIEIDSSWQELLNIDDNLIPESFLNKIEELKVFLKSGNKIETLHPLLFMPNLRKLRLSRTFDRPIDFSYISQFKQIRSLKIKR